jgi:hypothetical protein
MAPLPSSPADEADASPSASDDDSEEELFLSSLAQSLAEPAAKRLCMQTLTTHEVSSQVNKHCPTEWPVEVKIAVAAFLPWREVARHAQISIAWRGLEQSESLWEKYFRIEWPRLYHRKAFAATRERLSWRTLFRQRWAQGYRNEDAEEEHWNDLSAALDLCNGSKAKVTVKSVSEEQQIHHAVRRFKEDLLRLHGLNVPPSTSELGGNALCVPKCKYRAVPIDGQLERRLFVCELCADVHICRLGTPCDGALLSHDNAFLVCSVSGLCFANLSHRVEDDADAPAVVNDWDPELSAAQQHGRWFEQGYFMSEEQADDYFGDGGCRKSRSSGGCSR